MSIVELYESGTQKNNLAHFAAIVNIAAIDGKLNEEEQNLLSKFARKLNISEEQFNEVVKKPKKFSIAPVTSKEERLLHLYDLFKMIFVDHDIDEEERKLIFKYALLLGCSEEKAKEVIQKSIKIFSGDVDFETYQYLVEKNN